MTWVRMDDAWPFHPKILGVPPGDRLLWAMSIAYCSSANTDGRLSEPMLKMVAAAAGVKRPVEAAERLATARLLDPHPDGGWTIHNYLDYQTTAARRAEVSDARKAVGAIGGARRKRPSARANGKQIASGLLADVGSKSQAHIHPKDDSFVVITAEPSGLLAPRSASPPNGRPAVDDDDDDDRIDEALDRLGRADQAAAIAAGIHIRNHPAHLATCIAARQPDRPALTALAAEHPDWTAETLAANHANPAPRQLRCGICHQPAHPNGAADCPALDPTTASGTVLQAAATPLGHGTDPTGNANAQNGPTRINGTALKDVVKTP